MSSSIVSSSNALKWEVVGGNRKTKSTSSNNNKSPTQSQKPSTSKEQNNNQLNKKPSNNTIIEHMPPIKLPQNVYDFLPKEGGDISDDDSSKRAKKQQQTSTSTGLKKQPSTSPKQQAQKTKSSSSNTNTNASTTTSSSSASTKRQESDLEAILNSFDPEEFKREQTNFAALYPNMQQFELKHMISYLNMKIGNEISNETEPTFDLNDVAQPLNKFKNKKIREIYQTLIDQLSKNDLESSFDYALNENFEQNNKPSSYGYRIITQMIVRKYPDLLLKHINKYTEAILKNKHRPAKCLVALWLLAQPGFINLPIGLRIWFDGLLQFLPERNYTNILVSYIYTLLEHHKGHYKDYVNHELINIKQYLEFFDLVKRGGGSGDKVVVVSNSKEVNQKLNKSLLNVRELFFIQNKTNFSNHFEYILVNLQSSNKEKQNEVLECAKLCLINSKETYSKWREIYSKYLPQTILLLKQIKTNINYYKSHNSSSRADLNQTIKYFETNSALYLNNSATATTKTSTTTTTTKKTQQQNNTKTNGNYDINDMQKVNELAKELMKKNSRFSIMRTIFYLFFFTILSSGLFIYWDTQSNKSIYTNQIKIELEKYGLLDITLKAVDGANEVYSRVRKFVIVYVPPAYAKVKTTVVHYSIIGWNVTKDYSIYTWNASEPYRLMVVEYFNFAVNYMKQNFPLLIDNLSSVFYLFLNYMSTIFSFIVYYINLSISFLEMQVFGWKKGELAIVFSNGFQYIFKRVGELFTWLNETA